MKIGFNSNAIYREFPTLQSLYAMQHINFCLKVQQLNAENKIKLFSVCRWVLLLLMRNPVQCWENKGYFHINSRQPFYLIDFPSSSCGFAGVIIMNKRTELLNLISKPYKWPLQKCFTIILQNWELIYSLKHKYLFLLFLSFNNSFFHVTMTISMSLVQVLKNKWKIKGFRETIKLSEK